MNRLVALALLALPLAIAGDPPAIAASPDARPNILVIMTDDQSHDTLTSQFMPRTSAEIADQGVRFPHAYATTALCCPSRASFLTGRYAHAHGVHVNDDQLSGPTVANLLQDSGYHTGLVGKYLNSWPGTRRPEYDFWAAWIGGYMNPLMNIQGRERYVRGYQTHVLRDYALQFLREAPADRPFCLFFTPHAPHMPATPAPGDVHLYEDLPPWRPPSFNPPTEDGAPKWLANQPLLTDAEIRTDVDDLRRRQLACLASVDEAVGEILDLLRRQGRLDNTFIVFWSDNGYFWGEHRLIHKNRVYEEASRIPFAVRYPPLVASPRVENGFVANIDLAPTMCDLAGIPVPASMDGRSLLPLLSGGARWRDSLLLEGWPEQSITEGYRAVRTDRLVYAENDGDLPELYDVESDPYEMTNLAADPSHSGDVNRLRKILHSDAQ